MKNYLKVLIVFIAFVVVGVMGYQTDKFFISISEKEESNKLSETIIELGQIWLSETEDPFEEDIYYYILEIKENYVKFCIIEYNKENNHWEIPIENAWISNEISIFTTIYKKIK